MRPVLPPSLAAQTASAKNKKNNAEMRTHEFQNEASAISQPIDSGRKKDGGLTLVLSPVSKPAPMGVPRPNESWDGDLSRLSARRAQADGEREFVLLNWACTAPEGKAPKRVTNIRDDNAQGKFWHVSFEGAAVSCRRRPTASRKARSQRRGTGSRSTAMVHAPCSLSQACGCATRGR